MSAEFAHVANLEAAKRNRIRHSDEIKRGLTPSLEWVSLFDSLYVSKADEGPTNYAVLLRFREGKYRKVSTSIMERSQAVRPKYLAYPRIMLCDTKLTTAESINATMSSHSAGKKAQI